MRLRTSTALALLAVPTIALSACGSNDAKTTATTSAATTATSGSASGTAAPAAATSTPITAATKGTVAGVTVAGTPDKPALTIAKPPVAVKETTVQTLTEGTGAVVKPGDVATINVVLASGKTGKTLDDTFAKGKPEELAMRGTLPGLARGIVGQKAGSRVLVAVAPAEGAGLIASRNPQSGLSADETMVALVDIKQVGMSGTPCKVVTSKDGLPEVTAPADKAATIKPTGKPAPAQSTMFVLKEGTGAVVEAGQTLSAKYTGLLWADGKKFDSSFDRGAAPTDFPIGVKQVIPAWDKCLTGSKIGSQVMIVAPAAEAYGAKGMPPAIPPNAPLVFVVDVAGAK
ncbi:FKBP-type peptidyl-prolyl cis-trans isomerase [Arsenicicoccus dermatophilus]|uniref:FKBP-type peptidyl-prolyl cis-trans isomerase n=1 Tax=Arsenicicoccus dermatophilus TaxID=1076331 RepID=UPI001F4CF08A|nr:FKBP-type peptidyl-prolyl cis-trans isomerase [Arsenicicoccus dermatophilus]MCH8612494.1 FKBP-type peptidyl-prolyl cis-trans isomerase [Arsenicicoccus dermatophilus]